MLWLSKIVFSSTPDMRKLIGKKKDSKGRFSGYFNHIPMSPRAQACLACGQTERAVSAEKDWKVRSCEPHLCPAEGLKRCSAYRYRAGACRLLWTVIKHNVLQEQYLTSRTSFKAITMWCSCAGCRMMFQTALLSGTPWLEKDGESRQGELTSARESMPAVAKPFCCICFPCCLSGPKLSI